MSAAGGDTDGGAYTSVDEMWAGFEGKDGRSTWYAAGTKYWEGQEANINGVLGGYPETHGPDLRESRRLLELLKKTDSPPGFGRCLDCGAGIGRVTSGLLQDIFEVVDLVEPNKRLLDTARQEVSQKVAGEFICSSLETFTPQPDRYDVIWCQWVLLYLPDDDLLAFFRRCMKGLRRQGMIIVKENVVLEGKWLLDKEDNSIARTDAQYREIFKQAGLDVVQSLQQTCWPKDLIPVVMYALRPTANSEATSPSKSESVIAQQVKPPAKKTRRKDADAVQKKLAVAE